MTPLATFLGGLLLASTFYGMPPAESTDAAAARFEKQCAAADTPECKRLRWQLETALYDMLRANPEALDADILRVILWADTPELQTYALERLSEFGTPSSDQLARLVALLESPYATVRSAALSCLAAANSRYEPLKQREATSGNRLSYPVADPVPDAGTLGSPLYRSARFRPFASNERFAWFTTADAPDRVIAFYASSGGKAMSASEFTQAAEERKNAMRDPTKIMQVMMQAQAQGKSPTEVIEALTSSAIASSGTGIDTASFEGDGMSSPQFVELAADGSRVVVVFKDEILGATAIVFPLPNREKARIEAFTKLSPEEQMKALEQQQLMTEPLIAP